MTHKYSTIFRWINAIADYTLLNGVFYASFVATHQILDWVDVYDYKLTIVLLNFCWFYSSTVFSFYTKILKRRVKDILKSVVFSLCLFIILASIIKFILPNIYVPPKPLVYYFIYFPICLIACKLILILIWKNKLGFWFKLNRIAIVGSGPNGINFYKYVTSNPHLDITVAGIFDDDPKRVPANINYLGNIDACLKYIRAYKINEIYCTLPNSECARIENMMRESDKSMVRFRIVPDLRGAINQNLQVDFFGYLPVLKPRREPLENKANELIKRGFDILFSSLVIVLILSWLIPIIAIIIRLDSKGPVFFKQLRSGKNNKPFYCHKFRSMVVNDDSDNLQATKGDARVTRVGRFIRKTSIDELPQFIDVLLGNMSVVGPRPHMLKQTVDYSQVINSYMVRHFLTPGITGWAQVNGYRGEIKEPSSLINRLSADLWYLENWSILLDIKIIFLTVWKVLKYDEKAY
ncbi:undecaprenyl-phosphate glucose phosphotransferase [Pontibacter populi]|uniref:Undecaprenyl-phosphate glucose phosphotransferase n=1 Tax=Pontibacter populi TaxID=890055 RepID=A0ABV1RX48_9BACT